MLRSVSAPEGQVGVTRIHTGGRQCLRYVIQCFPRYYIDMKQTFDEYQRKFSSKTRATLNRKVKKFADLAGGDVRWQRVTRPEELDRFWLLARQVSVKTYRNDCSTPDCRMTTTSSRRRSAWPRMTLLRAFLLFDGERPVSYLFLPVEDGVVLYAYLGYDPEYLKLSWARCCSGWHWKASSLNSGSAISTLPKESPEQKRMFSTSKLACANIALLPWSLANWALVHGHWRFGRLVESLGDWLERHQLKTKVRRWLRFGFDKAT
jgi:hypothetical protein